VRAPRLAGVVGSGLAVAVWAAVAAFPTPLSDEPRPAWADGCAPERCEPGPPGLLDQVDARLALRMPRLGDADRLRLARTVVEESSLARLDPLLVLALIEVESSFVPGARSVAGARGLMQLREATLLREAERAGLDRPDPADSVANVRAGVRYLRRLVDAFGREDLALMAYNAGPNRILGYLREGEIPLRFRGYPRRVKAEFRRLRRELGQAPAEAAVAEAGVARVGG